MKSPILSPSMGVSLLALVIALGGAGVAATGGNFILGQNNGATTRTQLTSPINSDALRVSNTSTGAGATGLQIVTRDARPPMKVNSRVRVTNLNADRVDGKHAADFAAAASEGWHYIGRTGEPPFESGWENYDGNLDPNAATWQHAAYRIDQNGMVHLSGLIYNGTLGTAFKLPGQYCPWFYHPHPVLSNNALGRITVTWIDGAPPGCNVNVDVGSSAWVALDGISYRTHSLANQIAPPPTLAAAAPGKPRAKRGKPKPLR